MRFVGEIAGAMAVFMATTASAETVTIATFNDPSPSSLSPLFLFDAATNQLSGGWGFDGLTLETIGGVFEDATFSLTALPGAGAGAVGAGTIEFRDSGDDVIFTMAFDSAFLSIDTFGATEFNASNDVVFTGSILPFAVQAESFSFAFANQVAVGGEGGYSATAAFTSSAEVIPEPTTLVMLLFATAVSGAGRGRKMA